MVVVDGSGLQDSAWCSADSVSSHATEALQRCGVALIRSALKPEPLVTMLDAFRAMPEATLEALRHGRVREKRLQTHLPYKPPFDALEVLGIGGIFEEPLRAVLGDGFTLDLLTMVEVPPNASAQDPHRDTALEGSVAVHIPLHPLVNSSAPLSLCMSTHVMKKEFASELLKEAILWRRKDETSQAAKMRLLCGGRQRTEAFEVSLPLKRVQEVRVVDSRLGIGIKKFTSQDVEALGWLVGDEITHVDGKRMTDVDDWRALKPGGGTITVKVERPLQGELGFVYPPPYLLVGAPLAVGDAVMYDSRTFHWGMAHVGEGHHAGTRYVLYANFKSNADHEGVHPEALANSEFAIANKEFREKVTRLRSRSENGTTALSGTPLEDLEL